MSDFNKELEWKNHNPFFVNLNKDLADLKEVSLKIKDLNYLELYFDYIDNFITHYSPYMTIEIDSLNDIRRIIYSSDFHNFLRKNKVENQQQADFYKQILDTVTKLKKIHARITKDIYENGLSPRINTTPTKESSLETDPEKKKELESLEQAGLM